MPRFSAVITIAVGRHGRTDFNIQEIVEMSHFCHHLVFRFIAEHKIDLPIFFRKMIFDPLYAGITADLESNDVDMLPRTWRH